MNQILAISPYWLASANTWVFDDKIVGLVQEPFIQGIPDMIDELVSGIPNARQGFRLLFSASPFPGFQRKLVRLAEEHGGWWYTRDENTIGLVFSASPSPIGWLCPALFRYFDVAPKEIFVRAEGLFVDKQTVR